MLNFVLLVIMTYASLVIVGIAFSSINARWDKRTGVLGQNMSREATLLLISAILIVGVLVGAVRPII